MGFVNSGFISPVIRFSQPFAIYLLVFIFICVHYLYYSGFIVALQAFHNSFIYRYRFSLVRRKKCFYYAEINSSSLLFNTCVVRFFYHYHNNDKFKYFISRYVKEQKVVHITGELS